MPRTLDVRLLIAAGLAGVLSACSGGDSGDAAAPAAAEASPAADLAANVRLPGDVAGVVKERRDNFEAIGGAFKAIRGELDKDAPDFALIGSKAQDINIRAGKIVAYNGGNFFTQAIVATKIGHGYGDALHAGTHHFNIELSECRAGHQRN